jgi:hypothetical protein
MNSNEKYKIEKGRTNLWVRHPGIGELGVLWGLLKRVEKALMTCPDAQPISDLIVYIFKD